MNIEHSFVGYPGSVWVTCYQALTWLNGILASGATQAASAVNPAKLVFQLLRDGSQSIDAWQTGAALSLEAQNLAAVRALTLPLDPTTQLYFDDRIDAVSAAASGISALPPTPYPFTIVSDLSRDNSSMLDSGYLDWCMGFIGETPPVGVDDTNLPSYASGMATAWLTVTNAIGVAQGTNPTAAYDTAARMYRCSATVSNVISQLQSGPFAAGDNSVLWNSLVALPTILLDGSTLGTAPATLGAQQALVIRYVLDRTADAIALFLCSLRTSIGAAPITAILTNNDTLLDLAARETGDFENWVEIARINNLTPPYPGPTNQTVALSGQQLYMPGSGVDIGASGTPPSYPDSVMGVDYYFGPINGAQPAWNGDLATIRGLLNFAQALGRRLQTPLGSLTYHHDYGSRIPAEVGAIQSVDEAKRLAAFGKTALAADKRTGRILSAAASVQPGFLATFAGVVTPIGPNSSPVNVAASILPPGA